MVISYSVCPGWRVLHGTGSTTREALSGQGGITNETSASVQHAGYQSHEASRPCPASIQAFYKDVTSSHTEEGEKVLALKRTQTLILMICLFNHNHPLKDRQPQGASQSHSATPHSVDSSGRVISPTQRPLADNTRDIHAPRRNSNPNFQQARGCRPTP
jgi:hypothetical protein